MIDIIIVTFNRIALLKQLLFSIESQSHEPNKVIIYDDCSTDGTLQYLNTYEGDLNICVHAGTEKSKNVAVSRNKCLKLVESSYVIIMDDDDLMPPDKLKKTMDAFKLSGAKMITGDTVVFDENRKCERFFTPVTHDKPTKLKSSFFYGNNPIQWVSIAFESSALKEVGGFDERFTMITDWSVYIRIINKYDCWYFPDILGYYRIHSDNMSAHTPYLISDLEIFSADEQGLQAGATRYLAMSRYLWALSNGNTIKAVSVMWNYKMADISILRKIKLTIVAISGCFNLLKSFREGAYSKLGTYDSRIKLFLL